jgi:hypothetical protein
MDAHTVMEKWEGSPFDGGFDGLRDLQSRGFSGAVAAGDSRLFLRDGEPLAVVSNFEEAPREGSIETFEGAVGQAYEASHPGTVPLAAMLALDGEVRGRYFSDDTPLSKVHETLSGGGFTGYVELSENVLSGDYYIVYKDGDADYIGYISSSGRIITDEEAQEKAEGEIGIYEVVAVSLPDIEIPEASEPDTGTVAGVAADSEPAPDTTAEPEPGVGTEPKPDVTEPEPDPESKPASEPTPGPEPEPEPEPATEPTAEAEPEPEPEEPTPTADPDSEPATEQTESADETTEEPDDDDSSETVAVAETESETESASTTATERAEPTASPEETAAPESSSETGGSEPSDSAWDATGTPGSASESTSDPTGSVMEGVTTRSVPSIDPENTGRGEPDDDDTTARAGAAGTAAAGAEPERTPEPTATETQPSAEPAETSEPDVDVEARIAEVRKEYEAELESLRSELDSLRAERDRLQERVETLEAKETAGGAGAGAGAGGVSLTPDRALAGTSLFVRDEGPGGPTLEDAHAGTVDREELAENLRIEYHTQFEDEGATVDGEPFESFLRSSPLYTFTEWVLTDLLFEIQSTRSEGAMRPLYDSLPDIDRVSFDEPVTVGEGENQRDIEFDVVARDRMGEPLVVANMDESRDPTRAASLEPLIDDASDVSMEADRFAGAFAVTSSYFEPDALEAAREATSGSLLSREKYRNFVKLSRNNGFHLCLVESRDESFHMTMPEL